jgi:hypothetical protein
VEFVSFVAVATSTDHFVSNTHKHNNNKSRQLQL